MQLLEDMKMIAFARLIDAKALLDAERLDGAAYLCGYAIEVALKARICSTLGWPGYPSTGKEFERFKSFRTHDLDVLLALSGIEARIKGDCMADWSIIAEWDPETRYNLIGSVERPQVELMIGSVENLLGVIL